MDRITQLAAIGYILILITSGFIYWNMDDSVDEDEPTDGDQGPTTVGTVNITTSLSVEKNNLLRGENIEFSLTVSNPKAGITIQSLIVNITDNLYNRVGAKEISLDSNIDNGTSEFSISVEPTFPLGSGVVLASLNTSYTIDSYTIQYNTSLNQFHSDQVNIPLNIDENQEYDQAHALTWEIEAPNTNINQVASNFTISATSETTVRLQTIINGTGYPQIILNGTGFDVNVAYYLNSSQIELNNNILEIGNFVEIYNFTIIANITNGETKDLFMSMPTKRVILFAAIANNNFSAQGDENFNFREPSFYIRQASYQFERIFNVTIMPAKTFPISTPQTTDLISFLNLAVNETAEELDLPQDQWELGPGTYENNSGFDILLIFSNKTMDHLGVVFGDVIQGAYNTAINNRGSLNTADLRLPPSFADNLIQHEVSHVFGAPDRFTSSSPPSIMTKSNPQDAIDDIVFGRFWLYQTMWLEEDIQTMIEDTRQLYWN